MDYFKYRLSFVLEEKNNYLKKIYGHPGLSFKHIFGQYKKLRTRLLGLSLDTCRYLHEASKKGKSILFEGAQGTMLDVDHGTYPFVTSSNASVGGAITGSGVSPTLIDRVIGVIKAYTTRVGEGPFPTQFPDSLMKQIQTKGEEFGSTTGRPRRCGWFDAVVARHAVVVNGCHSIAVTKLDVLDEMETIQICVGYRDGTQTTTEFPSDLGVLTHGEPVYESLPGWRTETGEAARFEELPAAAPGFGPTGRYRP